MMLVPLPLLLMIKYSPDSVADTVKDFTISIFLKEMKTLSIILNDSVYTVSGD